MRKVEFKICRKCKKMYRWESGGIIMAPQDHMDMGLWYTQRLFMRNRKRSFFIPKIIFYH